MSTYHFEPNCKCMAIADEKTLECLRCGVAGSVLNVTDLVEEHAERGRKAFGVRLVMQLSRECLEGEELAKVRLQVELADARAVLRRLCDDHGDNDWDDSLYLADVLDKHLGDHLNS